MLTFSSVTTSKNKMKKLYDCYTGCGENLTNTIQTDILLT